MVTGCTLSGGPVNRLLWGVTHVELTAVAEEGDQRVNVALAREVESRLHVPVGCTHAGRIPATPAYSIHTLTTGLAGHGGLAMHGR